MTSFWTKRRKLRAEVDSHMDAIFKPVDVDSRCFDFEDSAVCSATNVTLDTATQSDSDTDAGEVSEITSTVAALPIDQIIHVKPISVEPSYDTSNCSSSDEVDEIASLEDELAGWATMNKVTQTAVGGLLKILHKWFPYFPLDPRTLLHTTTDVVTKETAKGSYFHYGLERGIQDELCRMSAENGSDSVVVQFNIDGLPLFKSSSAQFWPILAAVVNCGEFNAVKDRSEPFIVGLYFGYSKPSNVGEFLSEFVAEVSSLQQGGVTYCGKKYKLQIHSFCCDMPARAFIKCVTGHSGYGGCDKCETHGKYVKCVTFPEFDARLRTDESFRAMTDKNHHSKECVSPLVSVSVGMVSQFPIDYMHLVCLGVVRKLVSYWVNGPLKTRLGRKSVEKISERLVLLRQNLPMEFQRKPRPMAEYERWKATEFRQLLLYTGPVVLSGILPKALYDNFMLLSVAMSVFLNPRVCQKKCDFGHKLLVKFVNHFGQLYGEDKISYNVHGLLHLRDEVRRFGALDNVSAFPFENYLGKIKKLLKKPNSPIQQVIRRLSEQSAKYVTPDVSALKQEHSDGPLLTSSVAYQYKEIIDRGIHIRLTSPGDRFVVLEDTSIVHVENIIKNKSGLVGLVCRKFRTVQNFFSYPIPSGKIGVFQSGEIGKTLSYHALSEVVHKVVVLPNKNGHVCIPVLHAQQ